MTASRTLVLWARHGQNEANLSRQFSYRRLDLDLTAVGVTQAEQLAAALADRLRGLPAPPALFASPLRRAQQTAEIVARTLGVGHETVEGLRELNVGDLDGHSDLRSWQIYDSVLDCWRRAEHDRRFPGGENWHELCSRLSTALAHIASQAPSRTAVVVAHGANIRAALPCLADVQDPGVDLGTGQFAELEVHVSVTSTSVRLLDWRAHTLR